MVIKLHLYILYWILKQTATFVLKFIKRLVFVTEVESVYCAVRNDPLCSTGTFLPLRDTFPETTNTEKNLNFNAIISWSRNFLP